MTSTSSGDWQDPVRSDLRSRRRFRDDGEPPGDRLEMAFTGVDSILLFLHIPKTGGTTMEKYFYASYDPKNRSAPEEEEEEEEEEDFLNYGIYHYPGGFDKNDTARLPDMVRLLRRSDVRVVMGHFPFGVHEFQSRTASYTAIFRDPIERVISLGCHYLMWSHDGQERYFTAADLDEYLFATRRTEFDNDQTRRIAGHEPRFGDCTRSLLDKAKENLHDHFSVIGLTERFNESLVLFARVLGWNLGDVYYLPRLVNPRKPPRDALSSRVLELIYERNELDIKLYAHVSAMFEGLLETCGSDFEDDVSTLESMRDVHIRKYGPY
jgi:Galactose-3-O-sulfotransferase